MLSEQVRSITCEVMQIHCISLLPSGLLFFCGSAVTIKNKCLVFGAMLYLVFFYEIIWQSRTIFLLEKSLILCNYCTIHMSKPGAE